MNKNIYLSIMFVLIPHIAIADLYKCVNSDESISFQGKPCIANTKQTIIAKSSNQPIQSSPERTAKKYLELVNSGDATKSIKLIAINKNISSSFQVKLFKRSKRNSNKHIDGTRHVSFVDLKTIGSGAVIMINEDIKNNKSSHDIDPIYMVKYENKWWILPSISSYKLEKKFLPYNELSVYKSLEKWFKKRRSEIPRS